MSGGCTGFKFKAAKGDDPYAPEFEHTTKGPKMGGGEKIQSYGGPATRASLEAQDVYVF